MRSALTPSWPCPAARHAVAILALGVLLAGCGGDDGGDPVDVPDTQPPTVTILEPAAGGVSGVITVEAAAFDNRGVVGVQFHLDGALLEAEDTEQPYIISWNTTLATNGNHILTAVARDAAGYTGTSPEVTVSVSGGV